VRIVDLEWDDINIGHIAKHGVNPHEIEDICFGLNLSEKEGNDRFILSGKTNDGRYLNIVLEEIGKGIFRPITAFEMSEKYRKRYKKRFVK
jgi:uncharacterized DUF497 family protein